MWAGSIVMLAVLLALAGIFRGGLITSSNAMVGLSVVEGQQGLAYGLSQSSGALGGAAGSLFGGGIARFVGLSPVFLVSAGVYLIVGIVAARWLVRRRLKNSPDGDSGNK
jgi:MFS transporter, DHA1 family, multidrug resistance protein